MPVFPAADIAPGDPGALITLDYQYEFRGFLFGAGTEFQTEEVTGLLGMPSAKSSDEPDQEDHGEHAGQDLHPGRTINAKMNILGTIGDIQAKIDQCVKTFQSSKRAGFTEYPFVTRRPGHAPRFVWARGRRAEFPSNYETARGKAKGAVSVHATDPRWYTLEEFVDDLVVPVDGASVQGEIWNLGDFEDGTLPVIEITGPSTNPRITNEEDDNRTIRIDVVIPAGDVLVIDTRAKTVFLEGVDRFDTVRGDNQWWALLEGANTILYNRSGGGVASQCRIRHRDAWSSA